MEELALLCSIRMLEMLPFAWILNVITVWRGERSGQPSQWRSDPRIAQRGFAQHLRTRDTGRRNRRLLGQQRTRREKKLLESESIPSGGWECPRGRGWRSPAPAFCFRAFEI